MDKSQRLVNPVTMGKSNRKQLGKADIFGLYEIATNNPIDRKLVQKFNGSHLALWALGKNLQSRINLAKKIKEIDQRR